VCPRTTRNIVGGASVSLVYDDVGNLTNDKTYRYTYDVWGRVVKVRAQINLTLALYRYKCGGGRSWLPDRVLRRGGTSMPISLSRPPTPTMSGGPWMYFFYDRSWRNIASVHAVDDGAGTESGEYLAKADDEPRELSQESAEPGSGPRRGFAVDQRSHRSDGDCYGQAGTSDHGGNGERVNGEPDHVHVKRHLNLHVLAHSADQI